MSTVKEFKHETINDQKDISSFLQSIVDGIESGNLQLQRGSEKIIMNPNGMIKMEVKSKVREKKGKLTLELTWQEDHGLKNNDTLVINSKIAAM